MDLFLAYFSLLETLLKSRELGFSIRSGEIVFLISWFFSFEFIKTSYKLCCNYLDFQ